MTYRFPRDTDEAVPKSKPCPCRADLNRQFYKIEVEPWILEQFLSACKRVDFVDSVRLNLNFDQEKWMSASAFEKEDLLGSVETVVKEKFFFAGASARWMFDFSTQDVHQEIRDRLGTVNNLHDLLAFTGGMQGTESHNHLLMRFNHSAGSDIFFVSQCALDFCLRRWGQRPDIKYAYSLATRHNNPAFLGWIVQFDFFDQIKTVASLSTGNKKISISVSDSGESSEEWTVTKVIDFDSKADIFSLTDWQINHWILPEL
jgi:hypothetical protein